MPPCAGPPRSRRGLLTGRDRARDPARLGAHRQAAASEGNLAWVRLDQKRYKEALDGYAKTRATFESLGEPRSVAATWHQTGMVHSKARRYDAAEDAYRRSLAISVQETDPTLQAKTLSQLGIDCGEQGRLERSATFLSQAAKIITRSGDRAMESGARNNLAQTLLLLRRYDEARQELQRAIACTLDYGHVAAPWNPWAILENVERATGHPDVAREARQQAIATYLDYRRDGGSSHSNLIQIFAAAALAISQHQQDELARELTEEPDTPPRLRAVLQRVQAILAGRSDPTLADDPDIGPIDAAELLLLLETLGPHSERR